MRRGRGRSKVGRIFDLNKDKDGDGEKKGVERERGEGRIH